MINTRRDASRCKILLILRTISITILNALNRKVNRLSILHLFKNYILNKLEIRTCYVSKYLYQVDTSLILVIIISVAHTSFHALDKYYLGCSHELVLAFVTSKHVVNISRGKQQFDNQMVRILDVNQIFVYKQISENVSS